MLALTNGGPSPSIAYAIPTPSADVQNRVSCLNENDRNAGAFLGTGLLASLNDRDARPPPYVHASHAADGLGGSTEERERPAREHAGMNPFLEGPRAAVKNMNRNRPTIPRDETTRMVHSHARQSDASSWLRALLAIRNLPELAV